MLTNCRLLFLLLFIFQSTLSFSQEGSKKIIRQIGNSKGSDKLAYILEFCSNYNYSLAEESITFAMEGIQISQQLSNSSAEIELWRSKGISEYTTGLMEDSLESLLRSKELSLSSNDSLNLGKAYRFLGMYYFKEGDFKTSIQYYKTANTIAKKTNDLTTLYYSYNGVAIGNQKIGNYLKSIEIYDSIQASCEKTDFDCAGFSINRAIALNNIGRPKDALEQFLKSRRIYLDRNEPYTVAGIEHHIGYTLKRHGLYNEALKYYKRVHDYFTTVHDIIQLSSINENIGSLLLSLNKIDEAETHLKTSLRLKEDSDIKSIGFILLGLSEIHLLRAQYDDAIKYLNKAEKSFEFSEDQKGYASAYNLFSKVHTQLNNLDSALFYAEESLKINTKYNLNQEMIESYENLAEIYERQKKFDLVVKVLDEKEKIKAKILSPEDLLAITKMTVENDLQDSSLNAEENQSSNKNILWSIAGSFFILYIILFFYQRKKATTKEIKTEYLDTTEVQKLSKKLDLVMKENEPYLDQDLSLDKLALLLNSSQKKLSILLNRHLKVNFYDYVNQYRIEKFINEIEKPKNEQYSILGIANNCGFKSKSSFYRTFKKEKGISPSEYKKQLQ